MKSWFIVGFFLTVTEVAAHDCHGNGHHSNRSHSCPDCSRIGQSAQRGSTRIEALKGTVSEIHRGPTGSSIVEVWVKGGDSTHLVRLGPADFLTLHGLTLQEGGPVAVKGYRTASVGSDGSLMIATEIELQGKTVKLRSDRGMPLW